LITIFRFSHFQFFFVSSMVFERKENKSSTRHNRLTWFISRWRSRTTCYRVKLVKSPIVKASSLITTKPNEPLTLNRASVSPKEEDQETANSDRDGHRPCIITTETVTNSDRDGHVRIIVATKTETDPIILIREGVVGQCHTIHTPFGQRQLVYADYTASGRFLGPVESFFTEKIAPLYANTHTEASATGAQTTVLREEARFIVAQSVNAPAKKYATLFVGTGCSGAIEKIINVLGIKLPKFADEKWKLSEKIPDSQRPVVFIGPFEHHSNELPWRESLATVVVIPEDRDGCPDMEILEQKLNMYKARSIKIGSFCAGSNVTGIRIDVKKMTVLLHRNNALAFFDFAGSGAYCSIDVNGNGEEESMDAIFMSPHKFIGGPGCTGVLVGKRTLFDGTYGIETKSPTFPGGGTVAFVGPYGVDYEETVEAREDAGTPGIVQAIRTGLAFQVKEIVGSDRIEMIERHHCDMVFKLLRWDMNISLTGSDRLAYFDSIRRVPIFSFNVISPFQSEFDVTRKIKFQSPKLVHGVKERGGSMRDSFNTALLRTSLSGANTSGSFEQVTNTNLMLHPGFVVRILNDVYGIQARAGCSCTGPYGHRLFNMADANNEFSNALRKIVKQNCHAFKPGWARVNFNYFISDEELKFICDAITQVGEHGWKLLPFYEQELSSGLYIHRGERVKDDEENNKRHMLSLADLTLSTKQLASRLTSSNPTQRTSNDYRSVLDNAEIIYGAAENKLEILLSAKSNNNIEINTFTEPLPTFIECDKIWWATSQDVMKHVEAHGGIPAPSIRDRIQIPSSIIGIDDAITMKQRKRSSILMTDAALLESAQLLSRKSIQEKRDSMTPSFRTNGLDRDTLLTDAVYMAEIANMRSRG